MKPKNVLCISLILIMLMSLGACGKTPAPKATASPNTAAETQTEYRLTAKLTPADIESKSLAAHFTETAVISFTNTSSDTWERICLRDYAASNLELQNVMGGEYTPGSIREVIDSAGNTLKFEVQKDESVVYVTLSSPLRPGERTTVTVDYSTEIPCGGERLCWYPSGDYGSKSVTCLSQAYPMLAEYIDGKWNETPYFADGECFFSRCASFEMTLSVPDGCTVVSTGSEAQSADGTWTLKADKARDFAVIVGESFEKLTARAGDVTVNSYYNSAADGDKKQGEISLKAAVDAVSAFEEAWGKYPYDTLDVVQAPYNYGGMEYPGMVRIASSYAGSLESEDEADKSLRLDVAHEVAHEWFYAAVGNDQYREAWLDESFAVYGEYVYQLYTGESESDVRERVMAFDGALAQKYIDLSVGEYFDEGTGYGDYINAVYKVGPQFLWKLRQAMGAESFDAFMQTWYTEHMFKEVTTADFRAAIEKTAPSGEVRALLSEYLSPAR